jgi:uncharacterized protein YdeI (YjbR/CyaY-like superfamily)
VKRKDGVATRSAGKKPTERQATRKRTAVERSPRQPAAGKPATSRLEQFEELYVPDRSAWRRWLERHHDRSPGIWLVYDKKTSRPDRLAYADSVEEALCFGWIDSTMRPIDSGRYKQLFTPRKAKSAWSKLNKDRVERLIAQNLMTAAGLAKIDEARRSGSWTALDAVESYTIPPDLAAAFDANPTAKAHFNAFSPSVRKGFLYWLNGARRPETRASRLEEIIRSAAANRKVRSQSPRSSP